MSLSEEGGNVLFLTGFFLSLKVFSHGAQHDVHDVDQPLQVGGVCVCDMTIFLRGGHVLFSSGESVFDEGSIAGTSARARRRRHEIF